MADCRAYVLYFVVAGRITKNHNLPTISMTKNVLEL
jgi:hypothetical protein